MIRHYWLLLLWLLISGSVNAETLLEQRLASRMPEQQVVWLEGAVSGKFLALQQSAQTARNKGTALLIPDAGKLPETPSTIPYLRQALTQYGWNTLAITTPAIADDSSDMNSEQRWQAYANQLQARFAQAKQHVAAQPELQMIVAEGASAALLLKAINDKDIDAPDIMVIISPYLPDEQLNQQIAGWVAKGTYPLLDIADRFDNRFALTIQQERVTASKRTLRPHYRQRLIPLPYSDPATASWISKEIYGWMKGLGWY